MRPEIRRLAGPLPAPHRLYLPTLAHRALPSGLYADEPETCRRDPRHFLPILAHFGLMLALFKVYLIEGRAFQILMPIALAALPVHYVLPYRWKKPFFVAVSIVGLICVFGAVTAAYVLGLAALLIGVCFTPFSWHFRTATIAALALGMAFLRTRSAAFDIPDNIWPVVASMFMFRMALYLYEIKHARQPETLIDALSYFFLLPNACFMLFPVIDYRTFQRGYFAESIHSLQRKGLQTMFRGTTHLLLYRIVYFDLLIKPDEVHDFGSLVVYVVCNYALYLHVSGQFHIACGLLQLFGFQLPETHHHYFLATGFTDYWRRINIYWKDFMVRLVFNPVAFRLKRWPRSLALAVATTAVFVATWALHAYQWFWLCGSSEFNAPDALFWGILGAFVLVNVQLDARRAPQRRSEPFSPRRFALRCAKTAGTFATIALLWSLWSSPTLEAWTALMRRGLRL